MGLGRVEGGVRKGKGEGGGGLECTVVEDFLCFSNINFLCLIFFSFLFFCFPFSFLLFSFRTVEQTIEQCGQVLCTGNRLTRGGPRQTADGKQD